MVSGRIGRGHKDTHVLPRVGFMGSVPKVIGLLKVGPKGGGGAERFRKA